MGAKRFVMMQSKNYTRQIHRLDLDLARDLGKPMEDLLGHKSGGDCVTRPARPPLQTQNVELAC
jgi:hypothetical protein